jgi:hypothetical protein
MCFRKRLSPEEQKVRCFEDRKKSDLKLDLSVLQIIRHSLSSFAIGGVKYDVSVTASRLQEQLFGKGPDSLKADYKTSFVDFAFASKIHVLSMQIEYPKHETAKFPINSQRLKDLFDGFIAERKTQLSLSDDDWYAAALESDQKLKAANQDKKDNPGNHKKELPY